MIKTFLLLITAFTIPLDQQNSEHVKYQWNYLNFTWPSSELYNEAIQNHSYIPKNNIISGIKVWKDRIYLTLPRFKNGVPATMASISLKPIENNMAPLLEPFPNWEMQKLDDCSAFQFVQSMEIDLLGRMWILENGRTEFITSSPKTKCPTRLVLLDLEDNNKILLDYEFPDDMVHKNTVFLNDIVLDHEDGGYAYIADSDSEFPGVIVFSLQKKVSWKVTHQSMEVDKNGIKIVENGTTLSIPGGIDGIALSPASTEGNRTLYYAPLSSYNLYSTPVNQLKNKNLQNVTKISEKTSQTDGMFMNSAGYLFYGLLNQDSVAVWNTHLPFKEHVYFRSGDVNQWPDAFAIDENGYLYWTTTRLPKLAADEVDIDVPNYRVIVSQTWTRSYQFYQDKTAPNFPVFI